MGSVRNIELIFSLSKITTYYVKLQDTFAAETGAAGTWKVIGYIGPGSKDASANGKKYTTTTFDYTDEFQPKDTDKGTTMVNSTALSKDCFERL
ncbi:hypothetical protein [Fibrobacter sp. UWB13]|uniref:hypothetical protein n=1 Tax=Fibrobacter sp. UWB13 TaxID=1896204 RepID=UPI000A0980DE|nr:hypothetical protein [Fibrobacter sp. UWB13]SMG22696.1 hypothetical protein SAMN05720489_1512 [Fibrobacter sp. UWB13]